MKHYDLKSLESDEEKMRLIALFIPAIISLGITYRKNREKKWKFFDFIYEYAISLVSNVLLTESLISYVFQLGSVNIDAFDSFPFFTKYMVFALLFALGMPNIRYIVKTNISLSLDIVKKI